MRSIKTVFSSRWSFDAGDLVAISIFMRFYGACERLVRREKVNRFTLIGYGLSDLFLIFYIYNATQWTKWDKWLAVKNKWRETMFFYSRRREESCFHSQSRITPVVQSVNIEIYRYTRVRKREGVNVIFFKILTFLTWKCSDLSVSTISWSGLTCWATEDRKPSRTPLIVNFFISVCSSRLDRTRFAKFTCSVRCFLFYSIFSARARIPVDPVARSFFLILILFFKIIRLSLRKREDGCRKKKLFILD